jgi:hypothetical protein
MYWTVNIEKMLIKQVNIFTFVRKLRQREKYEF